MIPIGIGYKKLKYTKSNFGNMTLEIGVGIDNFLHAKLVET